jgi:exonuclease SbcD
VEPLADAGIEIWLLAGNHDTPREPKKGTSLDDFRGYANVKIFKEPAVAREGILLLPFLHPVTLAEWVERTFGVALEVGDMARARHYVKEWILREAKKCARPPLLFGHYFVKGARVTETAYIQVLPEGAEFWLHPELLYPLGLCVLGHIHAHQRLAAGACEVVYAGSPERIDWGEREEQKGFLVVSARENRWEWVPLGARDMLKIELGVAPGEEPTTKILQELAGRELHEKLLRLEATLPAGARAALDSDRINEKLAEAFHWEFRVREVQAGVEELAPSIANPYELLRTHIEKHYAQDPRKDEDLGRFYGARSRARAAAAARSRGVHSGKACPEGFRALP